MTEIDPVVRGSRRGKAWTRVGRGLHRSAAWNPRHADLRAWQRLLPESACFTHLTAARLHGFALPPVPEDLPTFVSMRTVDDRPRRPELRVFRHPHEVPQRTCSGLRIATPAEALLVAARDLRLLDMVVLCDSALHLGACSLDELCAAAKGRRWGAAVLRRTIPFVEARAESPWESVLRMFHAACEVPVVPQFEVLDASGRFVARGDLRVEGTQQIHEYDGEVHRDRRTHHADLTRDRRILDAGWQRRGYTSRDLLTRAHVMLREADAALGRPHDPARLEAWYALLRASLFSRLGQDRLRERWRLPRAEPAPGPLEP
jgi:hypothetical protein